MTQTTADMQACLGKLQGLIDEVQALMNLVDGGDVRTRAGKERARGMLRELKGRLRGEYARTSTVRGQAAMNEVERAYYALQVHEAYCHVSVSVSSIPDARWFSDLYEARMDLETPAAELRRQLETERP